MRRAGLSRVGQGTEDETVTLLRGDSWHDRGAAAATRQHTQLVTVQGCAHVATFCGLIPVGQYRFFRFFVVFWHEPLKTRGQKIKVSDKKLLFDAAGPKFKVNVINLVLEM